MWRRCFLRLLAGCGGAMALCSATAAADWPQWRGAARDGTWMEPGVVGAFAERELKPAWTARIGPGFSGPTVAGEHVVLMDRVNGPREQERVLCFDRATGTPRWVHAYPCAYRDVDYAIGPRAAVTLADGRAFAFGTMGHAHCLDLRDGHVVWARDMAADFRASVNFWGMSAAPLVVGELVIIQIGGQSDAGLVALDVRSGRERWRALDGGASYSSPRLIAIDGAAAVLAWTAQWIAALDPADGRVLWKLPHKPSRMVHQVADPVLDEGGRNFLLSSFYDGAQYFSLGSGAASPPHARWSRAGVSENRTEAIHVMSMTPLIRGGHAYGVDSFGELRCLDLSTGARMWENTTLLTRARWATAHFVQNADRTWIATETGELVIARLTPAGFEEISRARFITPDTLIRGRNEPVAWAHPAYAHGCLFARNDSQLVCIRLDGGR